jgi:hypothetical protein
MNKKDPEDLKFPIGKFKVPKNITPEMISGWISDIDAFPSRLGMLVEELGEERLKRQYREGGWTGNQVIHHCADSHMNSVIRMKLALTEDTPVIKPYIEAKWAELKDSKEAPAELSLALLDSLHTRWSILLQSISKDQLERKYVHPEEGREYTIAEAIAMYAWHCNHHLAHLILLKNDDE